MGWNSLFQWFWLLSAFWLRNFVEQIQCATVLCVFALHPTALGPFEMLLPQMSAHPNVMLENIGFNSFGSASMPHFWTSVKIQWMDCQMMMPWSNWGWSWVWSEQIRIRGTTFEAVGCKSNSILSPPSGNCAFQLVQLFAVVVLALSCLLELGWNILMFDVCLSLAAVCYPWLIQQHALSQSVSWFLLISEVTWKMEMLLLTRMSMQEKNVTNEENLKRKTKK